MRTGESEADKSYRPMTQLSPLCVESTGEVLIGSLRSLDGGVHHGVVYGDEGGGVLEVHHWGGGVTGCQGGLPRKAR